MTQKYHHKKGENIYFKNYNDLNNLFYKFYESFTKSHSLEKVQKKVYNQSLSVV